MQKRFMAGGLGLLACAAAVNAAPIAYQNAVTADNPYYYFRLGEGSGTVMTDSSANHANGSYVGTPTYSTAGVGTGDTAMQFSGGNPPSSYGIVANAFPGVSFSNSSFEFILKNSNTTEQGHLFGNGRSSNQAMSARLNTNLAGTAAEANSLRFFIRGSGSSSPFVFGFNDSRLSDGQYHHLVITLDGSQTGAANQAKAYLDGVAVPVTIGAAPNAGPLATTWLPSSTQQSLAVGANGFYTGSAASANFGTSAVIDEAAFYTTTLSASQVATHALTVVPEPATLGLLGISALGLLARRRKA